MRRIVRYVAQIIIHNQGAFVSNKTTHSKLPTYLLAATAALAFIVTIVGVLIVSTSYFAVIKAIRANNQLGYYTASLIQPIAIGVLVIGGISLFVTLTGLFLSLRHGAVKPTPAPVAAPEPTEPEATAAAPDAAAPAESAEEPADFAHPIPAPRLENTTASVPAPAPAPVAATAPEAAEPTPADPEATTTELPAEGAADAADDKSDSSK